MLTHRGLLIHPHELDERWLGRLVDLNINVLGLHPPGGRDADKNLRLLLDFVQTDNARRLLAKAAESGITVNYEMHALSYLMPRTLFDRHPDWFRENERGERVPDLNLCVSSREALDYLSEQAFLLTKALPSADHRYFYWLDDASDSSCHCARCRHLSPSDQQLIAVNALLRGIRQADPLGKLAYIAYLDTLPVPVEIKPDDGVFLEYAPIKRRMDRPLFDETCAENVRESRTLPDLLTFFGKKDAQVLEYWLDNSLFSGWSYPPKPFTLQKEVMRQDIRDYRALGFDSVTTFACYLGEDYVRLHGEPDIAAYGQALSEA